MDESDSHRDGARIWLTALLLAMWAAAIGGWWWRHPVTDEALEPIASPAYRIRINEVRPADLRLLPGVGATLAQRIVEDRQAHGPFADFEDLQRVRGIGTSVTQLAAPWVTFTPEDSTE